MYPGARANKGTLSSDFIRPSSGKSTSHNQSKNQSKSSGVTGKERPKSKALQKLESLLEGVRRSSGTDKDPNKGCFCQARNHDLSSYNSICRQCGLILCTLNLPQYACPHCGSALFTPAARLALISRLEEQVVETIAQEEEERARVMEELRRAAGAFPALSSALVQGGPTGPLSDAPRPVHQTHKVLSISKTKKVTISSYTNTPIPSRPLSRAEEKEEEPVRVPAPPSEPPRVKGRPDPGRPWQNLLADDVRYIPPPVIETTSAGGSSRKNRQKRDTGEQSRKVIPS